MIWEFIIANKEKTDWEASRHQFFFQFDMELKKCLTL